MKNYLPHIILLLGAVAVVSALNAQPHGHNGNGHGNSHHSNGGNPGNHGHPSHGYGHHGGPSYNNHPGHYHHHGGNVVYPHYKYSHLPRYYSTVSCLPHGAMMINWGGASYWCHSGVYYRPVPGGYCVVTAPYGLRMRTLPANYINITIGRTPYYYYYGSYYMQDQYTQEYYSVSPPVGATVDALPQGYDKVIIDGVTYYVFGGTYYKAFVAQNGEVWYEVVGQR